MKPKKWYKDKSRKEIAGVIAGLYDYFDLYENYGWKLENVRLVIIFLAIITNLPFLTAYIVLAILLPDKSELNGSIISVVGKSTMEIIEPF
ncbi:TPA: PspC domain-containing protein [Streptococcus suis]